MQEPSEWSIDWLKNTRDAAKLIESVKYNVDPTGLLVIGSVCKKDDEKNRTFHKETPNRNICNFCVQKFGDCIHLKIHEGILYCCINKKNFEIKIMKKNILKNNEKNFKQKKIIRFVKI